MAWSLQSLCNDYDKGDMMFKRRGILVFILVLCMAVILNACTPSQSNAGNAGNTELEQKSDKKWKL